MKAVAFGLFAMMGAARATCYDGEIDLVDFGSMDLKSSFKAWKAENSRTYESVAEEYERFATFVDNLQLIAGHNSDSSHTSKMAVNHFGDWTREEYLSYVHQGFKADDSFMTLNDVVERDAGDVSNPASVDWRSQGVVTPVKDQGQCGSCWAFSSTGSLECRTAIKTGTLTSLSEQQLVDCSHSEGNLGCSGGQMDAAFTYIQKTGGLCTESAYPYKAKGGSCQSSSCGKLYSPVSGHTDVRSDNEADLETATAAGCVSIAIEADQTAFQFYSSGIFSGVCGTNLDHGVLIVGYGASGSNKYWIVKNSWGTSWGMNGYIEICKDCNKNGSKGECGVNVDPSYPISSA